MAVWQTDWDLIPREILLSKFGSIPIAVSEKDAVSISDWEQPVIDQAALVAALPQDIKKKQNVFKGQECYGEIDGNGLRVGVSDKGHIEYLTMRIDLRDCTRALLKELNEMARKLDCVWLTENKGIVDSKDNDALSKFVEVIQKTRAFDFAKDPRGFIARLADE